MTSALKNMYFHKINCIVNRYNNTCHRTIKMKPIYEDNIYVHFDKKKVIIKIINFNLVMLLKYQNIKTFFLIDILQIGPKKFKNFKILLLGHSF